MLSFLVRFFLFLFPWFFFPSFFFPYFLPQLTSAFHLGLTNQLPTNPPYLPTQSPYPFNYLLIHIWKQCHFKCNRPHQSMYIFSFNFGYYKFENIKWALIFSSKCERCKFNPKQLVHIFKPTCEYCIFWQLMFEVGVIEDSIPKYNTHIWKMSLKIQKNIITNVYLPTQIWVLHVWSQKTSPYSLTPSLVQKSNAFFVTHKGIL